MTLILHLIIHTKINIIVEKYIFKNKWCLMYTG